MCKSFFFSVLNFSLLPTLFTKPLKRERTLLSSHQQHAVENKQHHPQIRNLQVWAITVLSQTMGENQTTQLNKVPTQNASVSWAKTRTGGITGLHHTRVTRGLHSTRHRYSFTLYAQHRCVLTNIAHFTSESRMARKRNCWLVSSKLLCTNLTDNSDNQTLIARQHE